MRISKMFDDACDIDNSAAVKHLYNKLHHAMHLEEARYNRKIEHLINLIDSAGDMFDHFADGVINEQGPAPCQKVLLGYMNAVRKNPYVRSTFLMECIIEELTLGN